MKIVACAQVPGEALTYVSMAPDGELWITTWELSEEGLSNYIQSLLSGTSDHRPFQRVPADSFDRAVLSRYGEDAAAIERVLNKELQCDYEEPVLAAEYLIFQHYQFVFTDAPLVHLLRYLEIERLCEFTKRSGCGDCYLLSEVKRMRRNMLEREDQTGQEKVLAGLLEAMLCDRISASFHTMLEIPQTDKLATLHLIANLELLRLVELLLSGMNGTDVAQMLEAVYAMLWSEFITHEPIVTVQGGASISIIPLIGSILSRIEKMVIPALQTCKGDVYVALSDTMYITLEVCSGSLFDKPEMANALELSTRILLAPTAEHPEAPMMRDSIQSILTDTIGIDCVRMDCDDAKISSYDPERSRKLAKTYIGCSLPLILAAASSNPKGLVNCLRVLGSVISKSPDAALNVLLEHHDMIESFFSLLLPSVEEAVLKAMAPLVLALLKERRFQEILTDPQKQLLGTYNRHMLAQEDITYPLALGMKKVLESL